MKLKNRKDYRIRRHKRLRQKVQGSATRPRMSICVTNSHMYVQFIDDDAGTTLASASTLGMGAKLNVGTAQELGTKAAQAAIDKGISMVVIDRGGFSYHGRVQGIVEAALEAGLKVREGEQPPPRLKKASGKPKDKPDSSETEGKKGKSDKKSAPKTAKKKEVK
jgi:large subunit ribosomal protein L18